MEVKFFNDLSSRTTIDEAITREINFCFENFSSKKITHPSQSVFLNEKYYFELNDALVVGNRSCLKDDLLYTDLPVEWSISQVSSYIERVRNVHKGKEFEFLSEIDHENGVAQMKIGRPYLRVDTPCIFVGCVEAWNFGFFISIILFKIFIANKVASDLPVLIPVTKTWQVDLLRYFFPYKKFIFYDPQHPVEVKNVKIIGWPNFPFFMDKDYLDFLRKKPNIGPSFFSSRKIYLSRRKFNGGGGRVNFCSKSELSLMEKGYMPLYPEEIPYKLLHAALSGCTHIAMESGSALFNCVFLPDEAEIFLFESREEFLNNHTKFLSSLSGKVNIIFCDESSIFDAVNSI